MNSFQTIVLGIFGFFIIAGLIVIATVKANDSNDQAVTVTLWGTVSSEYMGEVIDKNFDSDVMTVQYSEFPEGALDSQLVEALASGYGPDALILPAELIMRHQGKLVPVPYANLTERQFRDSYIQGAEIFLGPTGALALPFSVDPLVMYYNRDILESEGLVAAPRFWDEFLTLGGKLTRRDSIGNISRSAVALGEFRNISHAKEIIAALLFQSGNPIIGLEEGKLVSKLESNSASVLDFYTEFANSQKPSYSWNRAQKPSREAFTSSRLAIYFGFGSELKAIRQQNPNLNFDVAAFPNPRGTELPLTYGKISGIAVMRSSRNPSAALSAAYTLTSPRGIAAYQAISGEPPVRRDLLLARPTDAYGGVLFDGALRSRTFLDPNPSATTPIFQTMIESITSGKLRSNDALGDASSKLQALIR